MSSSSRRMRMIFLQLQSIIISILLVLVLVLPQQKGIISSIVIVQARFINYNDNNDNSKNRDGSTSRTTTDLIASPVERLWNWFQYILQQQEKEREEEDNNDNNDQQQGFLNIAKIGLQWIDNNNDNNHHNNEDDDHHDRIMALVALQDINPNDVLMIIPSSLEITGQEEFVHSSSSSSICDTAWRIVHLYLQEQEEEEQLQKSQHQPHNYEWDKHFLSHPRFLLDHQHQQNQQEQEPKLATMDWSNQAKQLMQIILGNELEPKHFGSNPTLDTMMMDLPEECMNEFDNHPILSTNIIAANMAWKLLPIAIYMVHLYSWHNTMFPIYDLLPYSYEQYNVIINDTIKFKGRRVHFQKDDDNDNNEDHDDDDYYNQDIPIVATRFIQKGERLYRPYDSISTYFKHYGIVPSYPHRWFFQTGYDSTSYGSPYDTPGLVLEVVQQQIQQTGVQQIHSDSTKKNDDYQVKWISGHIPNPQQLNWLVSHRRRLLLLQQELQEQQHVNHKNNNTTMRMMLSEIPNHYERQQIQLYLETMITDLTQAILWAHGNPIHHHHHDDNNKNKNNDWQSCQVDDDNGKDGKCHRPSTTSSQDSSTSSSSTTTTTYSSYDTLQWNHYHSLNNKLDFNAAVHNTCSNPFTTMANDDDEYSSLYTWPSYYQKVQWGELTIPSLLLERNNKNNHNHKKQQEQLKQEKQNNKDVCLLIDHVIHSCTSYRPHVHEMIVHYPAQFLNSIQRVLYVGGGDLFLLHEILQYDNDQTKTKTNSLELVIGMELDQDVVRSSFLHYGVQPHFDNSKVQWWFGDAMKSLALLLGSTMESRNYYMYSFDLVIIDLESYVFDQLWITTMNYDDDNGNNKKVVSITEYMMQLIKPKTGILIRQEDFLVHNKVDFAKYTMDLTQTGMSYLCQQSYTMASHDVDFSKQVPKQHDGIETLVFPTTFTTTTTSYNHTALWAGFRTNQDVVPMSSNRSTTGTDPNHRLGTLMIVEVEDIHLSLFQEGADALKEQQEKELRARIHKVVTKAGLTERAVVVQDSTESSSSYRSWIVILEEGYLIVRLWSEFQYCAFDLQLWNTLVPLMTTMIEHVGEEEGREGHAGNNENVVTKLVAAVGGNWTSSSTSSYQITTGGMFRDDDDDDDDDKNVAAGDSDETIVTDDKKDQDGAASREEKEERPRELGVSLSQEKLNVVLQELSSFLTLEPDPVLLVICADKNTAACQSLEALSSIKKQEADVAVPLWTCPSLAESNDLNTMIECEQETRNNLYNIVAGVAETTAMSRKIDGMVIDANVPLEMGQIVHKLFNNSLVRHELLNDHFVIVMPTSLELSTPDALWRDAFLERFRTEIVMFNPLFHSRLVVDTPHDESLGLELLSVGDPAFYEHLLDCLDTIRTRTELSLDIQNSKVGVLSYIPDFKPKFVSTKEDYNLQSSFEQWYSQKALGHQVVVQFEVQPTAALSVRDAVMIHQTGGPGKDDSLDMPWYRGSVNRIHNDGTFFVETKSGRRSVVDRTQLRLINDYSAVEPIEFGESVLHQDADGGDSFYEAMVVEVLFEKEGYYRVQEFIDGELYIAPRSSLIRMVEKKIEPQLPALSSTQIQSVVVDVLRLQRVVDNPQDMIQMFPIGQGCVFVAFFQGGSLVVTWDGRIHMDVNLFLENAVATMTRKQLEPLFLNAIPHLKVVQQNSQPRGYGRVVNFPHELDTRHWFGHDIPHRRES